MKLREEVRPAFRFAQKRLAKNLEWAIERSVSPGLTAEEFKILLVNAYALGAKDLLDLLKSKRMLSGTLAGYLKSVDSLKIDKVKNLHRNMRLTIGCFKGDGG
jgi:hypothetical protein